MGGPTAQVQQGQTSGGGKMGSSFDAAGQGLGVVAKAYNDAQAKNNSSMPEMQGANGAITNSATSGQPNIGDANQYSNTVGQWDNATQQPNQSMPQAGKGKGA